mmetsp:Transcript_41496/g.60864  ORF Transcript_41496/g.60864 Transcript_41496/m.60864 type:complete len:198 (-) Transcript_41496:392-985(-)|eukprot:CAMPEP_0195533472 /NCGR_PEP_ID=MMETSP0794_2-20130614/40556_1 /TAXON_ID=515487 /ORGANISM="Stephanopyxis turris, Strain CCMP 815" /LENGTH=197 /DNA_ID=CAMNT_0040666005 /DNA_START=88 /DNA_END=681 /DNA_ORIENTATION=-
MRVVILPGNGCTNVRDSNWYSWLEQRLQSDNYIDEVVLRNMPDPNRARRSHWLPFILSSLIPDALRTSTIVVGHSSGAQAALRLCETTKVAGCVLVAACHTDLGEPSETASGWYPPSGGEWRWDDIRLNAGSNGGNIVLLHSKDDPFIPISEPRHVAASLGEGVELREFENESHFFRPSEAIVKAVYDVAMTAGLEK